MKNTEIKMLRAETGVCSLQDMFGTLSCEGSRVLDSLGDDTKQRIRAFGWWMWFKRQQGDDPNRWGRSEWKDLLEPCFIAYDKQPPLSLKAPPLIKLDKDLKQWPLWEEQMRSCLRSYRGGSGLPLSYVVNEQRNVSKQMTTFLIKNGRVDELLEKTSLIPPLMNHHPSLPWWEGDSTRVYDLICSSICKGLLPSGYPSECSFTCGRGLWMDLRDEALQKHAESIFVETKFKIVEEVTAGPWDNWATASARIDYLRERNALSVPYFQRLKEELKQRPRFVALEAQALLARGAWTRVGEEAEMEEVASRRPTGANKRPKLYHHHWTADLKFRERSDADRSKRSPSPNDLFEDSSDDSD